MAHCYTDINHVVEKFPYTFEIDGKRKPSALQKKDLLPIIQNWPQRKNMK